MGIFSRIAERISHRRANEIPDEEIRSHVMGEYPPPEQEQYPSGEFARQPVPELPEISRGFGNPGGQRFGEQRFGGQGGQQSGESRFYEPAGGNSDMREALSMIEAQLATLRAQVETVNERLKNLEFLLRAKAARGY